MDQTTIRRLRGLNDLIADALQAGVTRTEQMHRAIARRPYAILSRIGPTAAPARAVEIVETAISGAVYTSIRVATRASGAVVAQVLLQMHTRALQTKRRS